jgi:hypothetical protein
MSETQTPLEARLQRWADAHEDLPECAYGAELARQATDALTQLRAEVARWKEQAGRMERAWYGTSELCDKVAAEREQLETKLRDIRRIAGNAKVAPDTHSGLLRTMLEVVEDHAETRALAPHAGGGDGE